MAESPLQLVSEMGDKLAKLSFTRFNKGLFLDSLKVNRYSSTRDLFSFFPCVFYTCIVRDVKASVLHHAFCKVVSEGLFCIMRTGT